LNELPLIIIYRCIKIGASFGRKVLFKDISLEPDGLTRQVRTFIKMHMYLFLREIGSVQVNGIFNQLGLEAGRKKKGQDDTVQNGLGKFSHRGSFGN
jgi:hypothetical protein